MKDFLLVTVLFVLGIFPSACGGGGQTQNQFDIGVKNEFQFDPATITVQPAQEVTITFNNNGSVEHSFSILKASATLDHVMEELGDEEHLHEELVMDIHDVQPGESSTVTFTTPSEPGEYTIACLVPGHVPAGMVGTLVVSP